MYYKNGKWNLSIISRNRVRAPFRFFSRRRRDAGPSIRSRPLPTDSQFSVTRTALFILQHTLIPNNFLFARLSVKLMLTLVTTSTKVSFSVQGTYFLTLTIRDRITRQIESDNGK